MRGFRVRLFKKTDRPARGGQIMPLRDCSNAFRRGVTNLSQIMSDRPFLASFVPTGERLKRFSRDLNGVAEMQQSLGVLALEHARRITSVHGEVAHANLEKLRDLWSTPREPSALAAAVSEYATDATQRLVLTLDVLREVGNVALSQWRSQHEENPVLLYEYASVVEGHGLERPVNYDLVQILPPPGTAVDPAKRPYIIIDPRAGHGPGIGGFKSDSQVGVALAHGHPVYFVIFRPQPEPGQTLADVTAAEGRFVREVAVRHPKAPKPVVIGNCQGGWATMLLAASIPDVTGPVVANGAPLSYWAGNRGKNPLRYMGGLAGGAWSTLLMSDLGNGRFDGANLVLNFEAMNPGNTWWRKYYNLYEHVDTEAERFAGFEKWWSGYYWMNEAEIRWIVENLFVGNRLQGGTALLAGRGPVDLRKIHAPIVVFASHGDDITPPPQALNWIRAVYASEREIAACGQRIVYMVHPDVGHLGIFVSAKVAKKEHERIVSTLEAIEALAPGLYEMRIDEKTGEGINAQFTVSFAERTMEDLVKAYGGTDDEAPFALVDRASGLLVDLYEVLARPFVQAVTTPVSATALSMLHPLRLRRFVLSDVNPLMRPVEGLATSVREARKPAAKDNPFIAAESLFGTMVESGMTFARDMVDAWQELAFLATWGNPLLARLTDTQRSGAGAEIGETLSELPAVRAALMNIDRGGYAEAVIRILIMMAKSRGEVRQSRLQRSQKVLETTEPFRSLGAKRRSGIIAEQTLIVDFGGEEAMTTLPKLLPDAAERDLAIATVQHIAGDVAEMSEATLALLVRLRELLGLPPLTMGAPASGGRGRAAKTSATATTETA
jgi:pimeloyl-ACP methyl ester carboxylesterase